MTIFLETSALVAILAEEDDASQLATRLSAAISPITGAHVVVETAIVLANRRDAEPPVALASIDEALTQSGATVVAITRDVARAAVEAFDRFGKGRHPAKLNFGDCLSYGCAKVHGVPLLFKGEDFAQTDVSRA